MYQPLQDFSQAKQDGNWPVAVGVRAETTFEEREDQGGFPVKREDRQLERQIKRV